MAGGTDEKWTNLGGEGRRHFQVVCGERVIDRLIRQLRERGVTDIWIVASSTEYGISGVGLIAPRHPEWGHEALNGQQLWDESGRTLYVYGDCLLTDAAMDTIVGFSPRAYRMFGRFGNHPGVKGGGGELFAFSFWPEQQEEWHDALEMAFALKAGGLIKRAGSWEAYRIMGGARGARVGLHRYYPAVFTNIGPPSDDFDNPRQFLALRAVFEAATMRAIA